jgi:hypothetical protein
VPGSTAAESQANGSAARSRASTLAGAPRVSAGGYGADPDMTVVMEAQRPAEEPVSPAPAAVSDEFGPLVVLIGAGSVRIGDLADQPADGVVVIDAPPSDLDERGVRAAQPGGAVLVVARDRTRNAELSRLVDRLRSAGAQIVGFVLTGGRSVR